MQPQQIPRPPPVLADTFKHSSGSMSKASFSCCATLCRGEWANADRADVISHIGPSVAAPPSLQPSRQGEWHRGMPGRQWGSMPAHAPPHVGPLKLGNGCPASRAVGVWGSQVSGSGQGLHGLACGSALSMSILFNTGTMDRSCSNAR